MKFFNLLKKELAEIINVQTVISFVIYFVLLSVMGNVMNTTIEDVSNDEYTINISDRDNTDLTAELMKLLEKSDAKINKFDTSGDDYSAILNETGQKNLIIIPEGFSEQVKNGETADIIDVSALTSSTVSAVADSGNSSAINLINACVADMISAQAGLDTEQIIRINSPLEIKSHTVVKGKSAETSVFSVMGKISMQNIILPVIVFLVIIMASQTIISAIANEKIDKTLETLLSAPVSRTAVIGAKVLSAGIVAILNAVVFMAGFSSLMSGATSANINMTSEITSTVAEQLSDNEAMKQLGLTLNAGDYILIGIQLFLSIMICLSISIILGALVTDTKQSQTIVMPIMIAAVIPYLISMFTDINTLPVWAKIFVYAIPFTHTFSSIPNIMFGHMGVFWGGLAYQAVFFAICLFLALKLFKSDKILTMSLNFGQKSKMKKAVNSSEE